VIQQTILTAHMYIANIFQLLIGLENNHTIRFSPLLFCYMLFCSCWLTLKGRPAQVRLQQPECTAAVRHQCIDRTKVEKYASVLKAVLDVHGLHVKPHAIWNMDETGVQMDHKPKKVVLPKDQNICILALAVIWK